MLGCLVVFALVAGSGGQNTCVSTSGATFTGVTCPNGTYCVFDSRYDQYDLAVQPIVTQTVGGMPIGCCPEELSTPCYPGRPYSGLLGCCPALTYCCVDAYPYQEHWVGCAEDLSQCCGSQICAKGYACCDPIDGVCCPNLLRCANNTEVEAYNSTNAPRCLDQYDLLYSTVNVTSITLTNSTNGTIVINATLEVVNATRPSPFNQTYECANQRCYLNDTCVVAWANLTLMQVWDVPDGTPHTFTYIPYGSNVTFTTIENSTEIGCCPPNTTACSSSVLGFDPYPAENDISSLFTTLLGCAKADEECCAPTICPSGMKCCRTRASYQGDLAQLINAANYSNTGNLTLIDSIIFQSHCCPINTSTCCAVEIPSIFTNTNLGVLPYCGKGDSCEEPMFGIDSKLGITSSIDGYQGVEITVQEYVDGLLAQRFDVAASRTGCFFDPNDQGLTCGFCQGESAVPIGCTPPTAK